MKKTCKKWLALVLCLAMLMPVLPTAFAADKSYSFTEPDVDARKQYSKFGKALLNAADDLIFALVDGINATIPTPKSWAKKADYVSEGFLPGQAEFLDSVPQDAVWSLGYANASILAGQNVQDGKHYVGGSLSLDKTVTEVYDDLLVRTVALNDGTGRGTVVFALVDGYGLSSTDVRAIRKEMAGFCAQKNIVSLNIGVLHQHSAVDTFGMNGPLLRVFGAGLRNLLGKAPVNGQNSAYMRNLFNKTEETIRAAVNSMRQGKLYYSTVDASHYVRDKRTPFVLDRDLNFFRFVPTDEKAAETWISTYSAHCVGNGAGQCEITGDYPYYMEKELREKVGANFMLILGAEQGTSQRKEPGKGDGVADGTVGEVDTTNPMGDVAAMGRTLAQLLIQKGGENAVEVEPLLNIAHHEVFFTIQNPILTFAGKCGLFINQVVRSGFLRYEVVSELGYMEMGKDLAFAIVPGELAAELAYGGCLPASESWRGTEWTMPSMQQMTGKRQLLVLGIMNDQVGYIIPSNDYMPILNEDNKSLELVSLGDEAAPILMDAYAALLADVRK